MSTIKEASTDAKQRAKLYVEFIHKLINEIPDVEKNKVVKEIHRTLMMLPEYWEEE
jgi:predicted RNase H-like HicB family nuclease